MNNPLTRLPAAPHPSQRTRTPHRLLATVAVLLLWSEGARAATFDVQVGTANGISFTPRSLSIQPGDTVVWTWAGSLTHSVTSGEDTPSGLFDSGVHRSPFTFSFTFPNAGTFDYFCQPHLQMGMVGQIIVGSGTPATSAQPLNVSTRMRVETGDNVLIGGFIVIGSQAKKVIVRAIGPSLPTAGKLANPTLELTGPGGSIASNDNWRTTQEAEIIASTVPPMDDLESAIVATLPASSTGLGYTAIVRGAAGSTGVGLVEVYDLDQAAASKLVNISTRGSVQTGDNVMIGGFILGRSSNPAKILARGLGPSLTQSGVSGVLPNPTLELRNANGTLVQSNDDWRATQQAEIQATGIPPQNDLESALIATLQPGSYTAILAGKNGATGVGLVELFQLP